MLQLFSFFHTNMIHTYSSYIFFCQNSFTLFQNFNKIFFKFCEELKSNEQDICLSMGTYSLFCRIISTKYSIQHLCMRHLFTIHICAENTFVIKSHYQIKLILQAFPCTKCFTILQRKDTNQILICFLSQLNTSRYVICTRITFDIKLRQIHMSHFLDKRYDMEKWIVDPIIRTRYDSITSSVYHSFLKFGPYQILSIHFSEIDHTS
jgi:hypothetical protein